MSTRGVFGAGILLWALALGMSVRAHPAPSAAPPAPQAKKQAAPAAPVAPANTDCLGCHEEGAARADGKPVEVKQAVFEKSIHGGLSCVDCHQDLAKGVEFPHPEKLAKVECATCHSDMVDSYKKSVHAKARAEGTTVAATCVDCHGTHDIKPKSDPESRTYHLNVAATCEKCHGNADIIKQGKIPTDVTKAFEDSIHGLALSKSGLVVAPTCSDCHGAHDIKSKKDADSSVSLAKVPATCGKCHEGIAQQFSKGVHGVQLAGGNLNAPACQTCHTAHAIQRAASSGWQLSVVGQCGNCHSARIATFRDTFHGQVTNLGFRSVASCADCHGAHEILPASDPRSPVAPGNLVKTCGKCHSNVSANFVLYNPHADKHSRAESPLLYFTYKFMGLLLVGVFGFFGMHSTMWFTKELHLKRERRLAKAARPATVHGARSKEGADDTNS